MFGKGVTSGGPTRGMFAKKEDKDVGVEEDMDLENRSVYGNLVSLNTTSLEMNILPVGDRHL